MDPLRTPDAPHLRPGDRLLFLFTAGIVYVTGFKRDIPFTPKPGIELDTYLHLLARQIARDENVDTFEIEPPADPSTAGTITITIRHDPHPYGRRPRGTRGSAKRLQTPTSSPIPTLCEA